MNILPLITRLKVVDKRGQLVPLRPNWAQTIYLNEYHRQVNSGRPARIITLKARQLGISTITEAIMFCTAMVDDNYRGLVVANEVDNAQHLLNITSTYWQHYPFRPLYTEKYASKNELAWAETTSSLKVATARNTHAGRSKTLFALHASEVAFWDNPEDTMLGLSQSIPQLPGTFICLESTANGVGNYFYKMWHAAEAADIEFVPLFFPWFQHPEYTASFIQLPYDNIGFLDTEERKLRAMGVSDERIAWRRWAIRNLCGGDLLKFHQEYPSSPEEAFIATGQNVFPVDDLKACYEPMTPLTGRLVRTGDRVSFIEDIMGPLRIYRMPSKDQDWGVYFLGGDVAGTTKSTSDYCCAQVINRRTLEQVATLRMRMDPANFGGEEAKLGMFYNTAEISSEMEGPGYATVGYLIALEYPNLYLNRRADTTPGKTTDHYGWSSSQKNKELMIGWLLKLVVDHQLIIHDAQTFQEMKDYITLPDGGYGNASSDGYDDTVTSLAIAVICHILEGPVMAYEGNRGAVPGRNLASETVLPGQEAPWEDWDEVAG